MLTLVRNDDGPAREPQEHALPERVTDPERILVDARHRFAAVRRARRRMSPMTGDAAER